MATNPESSPSPPVSTVSLPEPRQKCAWIIRKLLPVGMFLAGGMFLLVIVGIAQRIGWLVGPQGTTTGNAVSAGTIFTCPMHPQIRQPAPGRCPICGMELVPASSSGDSDLDELSVKIEPAQRRLANIQTAIVESGPLEAELQTVGSIAIDESRQATIAAYIDGRLERLFADYTGVDIAKGDHLAVIYSPQLYSAQVEYLEARRAANTTGAFPAVRQAQESLATNTRQRLREFGMTEEQLTELEQSGKAESRLTIYAPQGGTVIEKLAVEGNYVKAGDPIYRIAELSTVWLMLELFPEDATRIRFGQRVEAIVQSQPAEKYLGRVAFIAPTVNPATRTVGIRVELLNEDRRLRPGDYAKARINLPIGQQGKVYDSDLAGKWISPMHPQIIRTEPGQCPICGMDLVSTAQFGFTEAPVPQPEALYVPRSAVLLAGGNSVVYVEAEPGRFKIRPVLVGPILRDKVIILQGLKAGEEVATAGNFLIDSQMQLAGKPSLIDPARATAKNQKTEGPLVFENIDIQPIASETGQALENVFNAYFRIQQALAEDKTPPAEASQSLHKLAGELSKSSDIPPAAAQLAKEIASQSAHLHHLDLTKARAAFKAISQAIVRLATQVRSQGATIPFTHFYCPMVPGGGGDWLQATDALVNPYFGSEMLRCGEKVQQFPPVGKHSPQVVPKDDSLPIQPTRKAG